MIFRLFVLLIAGVFANGAENQAARAEAFAGQARALPGEIQLRWSERGVAARGFSARALATLRGANWTTEQWQRLLAVYAEQGDALSDINLPPVAGTYRIEKGAIHFEPKFPLEPNVTYNAVLRPDALPGGKGLALTASHRVEKAPPEPATVVAAIYPSASSIPENILKFYIHFSAPMSGGNVYEHIQLRDANGKSVELPFLEIDEELWNPEMTRLTLFLDPGRIKRGVRPLEEIGASFEAGKRYILSIGREWLDARGAPLKRGFEKSFTVVAADREPPDPEKWKIAVPGAGTRNAVRLVLNEPLDHGILRRTLRVVDRVGSAIEGRVEIMDEEKVWTFTPEEPWKVGEAFILAPSRIEDLAGNNIGKPFDVDLAAKGPRHITTETVRLSFVIQ